MTKQLRVLLDALEVTWRQMAPADEVARALLPGAEPEELGAAEEELGHPLTSEARTFYSWHNGVLGLGWRVPLGPTIRHLGEALGLTLDLRDELNDIVDRTYADAEVDWSTAMYWADQGGGNRWWLVPEGELSRVVNLSDGQQGPSMPSIASVIELQLASLATGQWEQNERGRWTLRLDDLSMEQRLFGWLT